MVAASSAWLVEASMSPHVVEQRANHVFLVHAVPVGKRRRLQRMFQPVDGESAAIAFQHPQMREHAVGEIGIECVGCGLRSFSSRPGCFSVIAVNVARSISCSDMFDSFVRFDSTIISAQSGGARQVHGKGAQPVSAFIMLAGDRGQGRIPVSRGGREQSGHPPIGLGQPLRDALEHPGTA